MVILYNPLSPNPVDIKNFRLAGIGEIEPHLAGELKQYPEDVAEKLVETYEFLQEKTAEEAKKILENKGKTLKCDFVGCEFATDVPVALAGHSRTHLAASSEAAIDPNIVPIAGSSRVIANKPAGVKRDPTENGVDEDGVTWYGEGLQVEQNVKFIKPGDAGVFSGG